MGLAANEEGLGECAYVVALLFAVSVLLVFDIWRPRDGWRFERNAKKAINLVKGLDEPQSAAQAYEGLAYQLEDDFRDNEKLLHNLQVSFQALLVVVGALVCVVFLFFGLRG